MNIDLSILICTHNSGRRITESLNHLQNQSDVDDICWEVVIVDYISSDCTVEIAKNAWHMKKIPLIIIEEQMAGKTPALESGLRVARGNAICIIDDDNWVSKDYLSIAHRTMKAHTDIGVIGAFGIAECEIQPPEWFNKWQGLYAVGSQGSNQGYIKENGSLSFWGAGSVIRREAWLKAKENGFVPRMNPTRGQDGIFFSKGFSGGEDGELCYAIQLAGFRLWYEPALRYKHYIPKERLSTDFVVNTLSGCSAAAPLVRLYLAAVTSPSSLRLFRRFVYENWSIHMLYIFARYLKSLANVITKMNLGDSFEFKKINNQYCGEIRGLWHLRSDFAELKKSIQKIRG